MEMAITECLQCDTSGSREDKERRARKVVAKMVPRPPRNLKVVGKTCDQVKTGACAPDDLVMEGDRVRAEAELPDCRVRPVITHTHLLETKARLCSPRAFGLTYRLRGRSREFMMFCIC